MTIKTAISGTYDINVKQINLPESMDVYLVDNSTNDSTNLKNTPNYSGFISNTEGDKRFDLYFTIYKTGIEDDKAVEEATVSLFPNPLKNFSTLKFANQNRERASISVYNENGQEVRTMNNITNNKITIAKGNLASGVYFININIEGR
ncbi:MAG: T9SS type A sorting domain-containing protein, partial [Bacteroidetes bacterium]|nr:T9SS type A sorting domain-containing protein [Bacteroidota bacterium]